MNAARILVVDDDRDVSRYVALNLTLEGYEVHVEHNGDDALAAARRIQPDLILLDVMMPGQDGFSVCRALRADPRTASTSIMMLTARTLSTDRVTGLDAGADDYIAKPFDADELVARVAAALRRSRQLRDVSPLTGLPGNFQIRWELERLVGDPGAGFALIYADLNNFKAYNDRYSWLRGDEAIRATAGVISQAVANHPGEPSLVGHIGGDDFMVIASADLAEPISAEVVDRFDATAPDLYDPEDAKRGWIELADRVGRRRRYPLLTIALGVATTERRRFANGLEASAVATEMKLLAKRQPGSAYEIDRRTGPAGEAG